MKNKAMQRKLRHGDAVDIAAYRQADKNYKLPNAAMVEVGTDYCDAELERWVWIIGEHPETGEVKASVDADFCGFAGWRVLWMR